MALGLAVGSSVIIILYISILLLQWLLGSYGSLGVIKYSGISMHIAIIFLVGSDWIL